MIIISDTHCEVTVGEDGKPDIVSLISINGENLAIGQDFNKQANESFYTSENITDLDPSDKIKVESIKADTESNTCYIQGNFGATPLPMYSK